MKKLLLSTSLIVSASVPAFAQDAGSMFRTETGPTEIYASEFIGMRIYQSEAAVADDGIDVIPGDWEDIGEIHDVILSRDGQVEAVLADIGGFLGMGEHQVAVQMDSVQFVSDNSTMDDEGDFFLVLNAPADSLQDAPAYMPRGTSADAEMGGEKAEMTPLEEGTEAPSEEMADETADAGAAADAEATADTGMTETETDSTAAVGTGTAPAAETDATGDAEMTGDADVTAQAPAADPETGVAEEPAAVPVELSNVALEELDGASVYDATGDRIGEISEVMLSDDGSAGKVVIDVGGFLGIGEKAVLVEMSDLEAMRENDELRIQTPMTQEQMEALPEYAPE